MATIIAAPIAATTIGSTALASAATAVGLLPGIAVLMVGIAVVGKLIEVADENIDEYRCQRMDRRYGADQNQNLAYKRFLERRNANVSVRPNVLVPATLPATPAA